MEISGCLCCEDVRLILEDTPGRDAASSYKCCRGIVHIKRATMYVGISALILSFFSAVCLGLGVYSVNFWLDVFLIVINSLVAIILLIGLYIDNADCMVPFIVVEIAQCAGFFMLANYTLYFTIVVPQKFLRKFDQMLMVVSIYIGIIVAGSAVWAAAKCYHYLKSKEADRLLESQTESTALSTYSSWTTNSSHWSRNSHSNTNYDRYNTSLQTHRNYFNNNYAFSYHTRGQNSNDLYNTNSSGKYTNGGSAHRTKKPIQGNSDNPSSHGQDIHPCSRSYSYDARVMNHVAHPMSISLNSPRIAQSSSFPCERNARAGTPDSTDLSYDNLYPVYNVNRHLPDPNDYPYRLHYWQQPEYSQNNTSYPY